MEENTYDIFADINSIVEKAGGVAEEHKVPECTDTNCPLLLADPNPFSHWLNLHKSFGNPDFVVGLAYPDRNPIVRFLRSIMPEDVGSCVATINRNMIIIAKSSNQNLEIGTEIGSASGGTPIGNVVGDDVGVVVHSVPEWVNKYMDRLRDKYSVGEYITAQAALDILRETVGD